MRKTTAFGIGLAMLALAVPLLAQKQFSGEIVDSGRNGRYSRTRIFMGEKRIRFEPEGQQSGSPMDPTAIIMNSDNQDSYVVIDDQKLVVKNVPSSMRTGKTLSDLWWHLDVNDPCGSMRKWRQENNLREERSDWFSCKNLGSERVNGRSATKWQATNGEGKTGYFWLDSDLHFPLKIENEDTHMTLENIKEGSQPSSLFEPPPGYRIVTIQELMQEQMGRRQRP